MSLIFHSENVVKILLESPMKDRINELDSQNFNALYYAVYHGHLPVTKLLKAAEIEYKKDEKDTSCLHIAVMRGHTHIVDFFLKKTPKILEA